MLTGRNARQRDRGADATRKGPICGKSLKPLGEPSFLPVPHPFPLVSAVPFVLFLLAIALGPVVASAWWGRHRNQAIVAAAVSLPVLLYLGFGLGDVGHHLLAERVKEYVSFIVVIAALFVISGGVVVRGSLAGTPLANTRLLAIGAALANLAGTTGASALLIRPLLRANQSRQSKAHIVVFFIFVVSNCGGLLTPMGDPPLLLGFLKGVPFEWTLRLWPQWLVMNGVLLLVFYLVDRRALAREEAPRHGPGANPPHAPFGVDGLHNLAFLGGVIATIVSPLPFGIQEVIIAGLAAAAYRYTPATYRERNGFTFGPIIEVTVLFAAIFVTMGPVLEILNAWAQGQRDVLGLPFTLRRPWEFFWATGALSSVLDNAPTYLAFSASAAGLANVPAQGAFLGAWLATDPAAAATLAAISTGAVFMGSMTYIGNAPNFMVRAIAEEAGVKMPSFFGYVGYSVAVLVPVLAVVSLVFF